MIYIVSSHNEKYVVMLETLSSYILVILYRILRTASFVYNNTRMDIKKE